MKLFYLHISIVTILDYKNIYQRLYRVEWFF